MPARTVLLNSYSRIWETVRRIPRGKVATYGNVARLAGRPGHARLVGYALHNLPPGIEVPWQRVINSRGMVSLPGASGARQRELLIREGIRFRDGRVDMEEYGWSPEQLSALQKRRSKDLRAGPRKPGAKGRK